MSEFKNAIEKYAKYVIQQSRSNLTKAKKGGGNLYNSLDYDLKQNRSSKGKFESGYNVEFFMEDYGIYQDLGVKGIGGQRKTGKNKGVAFENKGKGGKFQFRKGVPNRSMIKSLNTWIKRKGIKGRNEKTGRFITNQSLSFAIAKSVFHTGIKRSLFFTKPFEAGITKYDNDIANAYGDDILRQL
tara:strand:- start:67 stop:621 length:555 start_codon:yes stop_codon:yes gene_type:complete